MLDLLLQTYLKFEQSSGDPARVQILYERAVADFPISSDLWLDYTLYMGKTLKVSSLPSPFNSLFNYNGYGSKWGLFCFRLPGLWETFIIGPRGTVPGLENCGLVTYYVLNVVVLLRMNYPLYALVLKLHCFASQLWLVFSVIYILLHIVKAIRHALLF